MIGEGQTKEACNGAMLAVKDTLYVLNGKWKLPLMLALREGPMRFKDIQASLGDITPKMLSKELRELELNEFVERKVFNTVPVTITYELTEYSDSVHPIIEALKTWGETTSGAFSKGKKNRKGYRLKLFLTIFHTFNANKKSFRNIILI